MPMYDYACRSCDNKFVGYASIADMEKPTQTPCKTCGGEIYKAISAPAVNTRTNSKTQLNAKDVPSDFRNLMQDIHKKNKTEYQL